MLGIRAAATEDCGSIWRIMEPIIQAGDTYALPREMNREEALAYWCSSGHEVFVADDRSALAHAKDRGFGAMQFNFVVSTNQRAVRLWQSFQFEIVGQLPGAFLHPQTGYVDAYVMYRML